MATKIKNAKKVKARWVSLAYFLKRNPKYKVAGNNIHTINLIKR